MYQVKEKDWQLFRKRLPLWQEAHIDKLNQEYIRILQGEGNASDKFWGLEEQLRRDKKSVGVVADMRRSQMYTNLVSLLLNGIIQEEDLDGFSDELLGTLKCVSGQYKQFAE